MKYFQCRKCGWATCSKSGAMGHAFEEFMEEKET